MKWEMLCADLLEWGVELSDRQRLLFSRYYERLLERNKVMNLTAITKEEEVSKKHFLDSLSLVRVFPELVRTKGAGVRLLDLGTGAGFPAIPLKIMFPELSILMMDSLNKRVVFLQEVIEELELSGTEAVHARAEEAARSQAYRESFDVCVSRAVARMASLSELCLPFVKPGGYFVSYKSATAQEETEEAAYAVERLGGAYERTERFFLPNSDLERCLIAVRKVKPTPTQYPRAGGKPLAQPLRKEAEARKRKVLKGR